MIFLSCPVNGNPGQALNARSPKKIEEHGFGVVIGMMGRGDLVKTAGDQQFLKEVVPEVARRFLNAKFVVPCVFRSIRALNINLDAVMPRPVHHQLFVTVRFGATKLEIEVRDDQPDPGHFLLSG